MSFSLKAKPNGLKEQNSPLDKTLVELNHIRVKTNGNPQLLEASIPIVD
jgi:hypothetical protein